MTDKIQTVDATLSQNGNNCKSGIVDILTDKMENEKENDANSVSIGVGKNGFKCDTKENSHSHSNGDAKGVANIESNRQSTSDVKRDESDVGMNDYCSSVAEVNANSITKSYLNCGAKNEIIVRKEDIRNHSNGYEKPHLNGDKANYNGDHVDGKELNGVLKSHSNRCDKVHSNGRPIHDVNGVANTDCLSNAHGSDTSDNHSDARSALKHRCLHCDFQTSFRGKLSTHLISKHSDLRKEKKKI